MRVSHLALLLVMIAMSSEAVAGLRHVTMSPVPKAQAVPQQPPPPVASPQQPPPQRAPVTPPPAPFEAIAALGGVALLLSVLAAWAYRRREVTLVT
jgi:hypothetical protein